MVEQGVELAQLLTYITILAYLISYLLNDKGPEVQLLALNRSRDGQIKIVTRDEWRRT